MADNQPAGPVPAKPADGSPLRVLVDTNVALDVLLAREPWASQARPIYEARDAGRVVLHMPASVVTDIFYVCRKQVGIDRARGAVRECLSRYVVLTVDQRLLLTALAMSGSDFEDNVQIACALDAGLDLIVTRNAADFANASVPVIEPVALAARLGPS